MAKNTKKKAKFKEVTFTINKNKFKELLALVLKHNQSCSTCGGNILNGVKMNVKGNILTLVATDGYTLLELENELSESVTNEAEAVLVGVHLEKLALKKDYYAQRRSLDIFDVLEITIKEESTIINDVRNQIKYNIPHYMGGEYPDYKKFFPENVEKNEDYIKVGVNMALLAKLGALTQYGVPSVIAVNKNPEVAIIVKSNYNGIKSRSILMPCIIRE